MTLSCLILKIRSFEKACTVEPIENRRRMVRPVGYYDVCIFSFAIVEELTTKSSKLQGGHCNFNSAVWRDPNRFYLKHEMRQSESSKKALRQFAQMFGDS